MLIFIKNPRLGKVKTRLARTVGPEEALRIYGFLLDKTREAALAVAAQRWLFYSEECETADGWPEADFQKFVQRGDDLGARMAAAFEQAFRAGATRAVVIGSDCPGLNGAFLDEAFSRLDDADFVLGPTPDGGYYLLGMKAPAPALFQDIPWSTETVRALTLEKIRAAGKSCSLLPELSDIDTEEDWRNFQSANF